MFILKKLTKILNLKKRLIIYNYVLIFSPNSDLVAVLKQMFRFYIQQSMYLPIQLALESLVDLCLTEYINPEALIKMIDSNVSDIHHTSVISRYSNINI